MTTLPPAMLPEADSDADASIAGVTRFEVIDEIGRVYVRDHSRGPVQVELSYQDDDRTRARVDQDAVATPPVHRLRGNIEGARANPELGQAQAGLRELRHHDVW